MAGNRATVYQGITRVSPAAQGKRQAHKTGTAANLQKYHLVMVVMTTTGMIAHCCCCCVVTVVAAADDDCDDYDNDMYDDVRTDSVSFGLSSLMLLLLLLLMPMIIVTTTTKIGMITCARFLSASASVRSLRSTGPSRCAAPEWIPSAATRSS